MSRIFLDWGYTRLKVWIYSTDETLIYERLFPTTSLCRKPSFYEHRDLIFIAGLLRDLICRLPLGELVQIYACSQMHAVAGLCEGNRLFVSTWNDLAAASIDSQRVEFCDGVPLLPSMPVYKVLQKGPDLYFQSEHSIEHGESAIRLMSLASPLTLILNHLLNATMPCSLSWWQSTCMSAEMLDSCGKAVCRISEDPLHIPACNVSQSVGLDAEIVIYPEVGDLQASTFSACASHDVVLNLGTGSQMIIPSLTEWPTVPAYRYYNSALRPVPVVSHIPCGRLITDFVEGRKLSYGSLRELMTELSVADVLGVVERSKMSLLAFPGFSCQDLQYSSLPLIPLSRILELPPNDFLALWISQYFDLALSIVASLGCTKARLSMGCVGSLGGFAEPLVRLMSDLLITANVSVLSSALSLPASLLGFHENAVDA